MRHKISFFKLLTTKLFTAIGLVLVWRGVWYVLDGFDLYVFKGSHVFSALIGIAVGIMILYLPDHNLKEIEKF
jgi:hypothetical protein